MGLDAVRQEAPPKVDLSDFFDEDRWVQLKHIPPYERAQIAELSMEGVTFTENAKAKTGIGAVPVAQGWAKRTMQVRDLKLTHGVADHNFTVDGKKTGWAEPLWKLLDEYDPAILQKVIEGIERHDKLKVDEGDTDNPT